jgi:hypothetical protein
VTDKEKVESLSVWNQARGGGAYLTGTGSGLAPFLIAIKDPKLTSASKKWRCFTAAAA